MGKDDCEYRMKGWSKWSLIRAIGARCVNCVRITSSTAPWENINRRGYHYWGSIRSYHYGSLPRKRLGAKKLLLPWRMYYRRTLPREVEAESAAQQKKGSWRTITWSKSVVFSPCACYNLDEKNRYFGRGSGRRMPGNSWLLQKSRFSKNCQMYLFC